jgi:replicative DNA helicase
MLSSAQRYVAAVIQGGKIEALLKHGPAKHLFKGEEEKLWNYFDHHVKKYGTVPDFELVKADTGFDLAAQLQPAEFYLDKARANYTQTSLTSLMTEVHEKYLKGAGANPADALNALGNAVMALSVQNMGSLVLDYRDAQDLIMQAFKAKLMGGVPGLHLGWPTLDAMTGGLVAGDLISIAGRPASGKTWFVLSMALNAWLVQGKVPLFLSMEIKPLPIEQRLLAIQGHLPAKGIDNAALTSTQLAQMKKVLAELGKSKIPFHVVDGNLTSNVSDVYALVRQLKPDLVIIDGAYLLTHPTEKNRFIRVAENASLIKQQICDLAPTICSWQFAKPPKTQKGEKKKQLTDDDIGHSDAILQLSSLALGIMQEESNETLKQREVSVLKGRKGETGKFTVNWDFDWTTDFSEILPDSPEQMEELYAE